MAIILQNGNLIDGRGNRLDTTDLLVDDKRIRRIGQRLAESTESVDEVRDLSGKTVMPGMIDCHLHICKGNASGETNLWTNPEVATEAEEGFLDGFSNGVQDAIAGVYFAHRTLQAGFTTVRDVGGAADFSDIALREAVKRNFVVGPRILACGGGLAMTGGHGWKFGVIEADGPDEVRRAARIQLKAGADFLKIMATRAGGTPIALGGPEFTIEEMRVICEEAHKVERRVAAHAVGAEGIKNAIEAGVDTIEHGCLADDEALDMMVDRGVYFICTLYPYHNQAYIAIEKGYSQDVAKPSIDVMEAYPETVKKALDKGVKIALGSDCGIRDLTPHGENATELEMIVKLVGVSEMEAIELATRAGAEALGLEDDIGTLQEGKLADIIVIDGDPLADIGALKDPGKIFMVMKEGEVLFNAIT